MFAMLTRLIVGRLALGFGIFIVPIMIVAGMNAWSPRWGEGQVRR